jgi:hypothetical protein
MSFLSDSRVMHDLGFEESRRGIGSGDAVNRCACQWRDSGVGSA